MPSTSNRAQEIASSLVALLKEGDELALLPGVISSLQQTAAQYVSATRVISAVELTKEEQESIKQALETDQVEFAVQPDIIGGLVVERDGRRLDLSLKRTIS